MSSLLFQQNAFADSVKTAALALGSIAVICAAVGNSLTWHFQHYWGASRDLWQSVWLCLYDFTSGPYQYFLLTVAVPLALYSLVFWSFNALLIYMDITCKPEFIRKFKVQEDKNSPVDLEQLRKCIRRVLFNGIVVGGATLALYQPLFQLRGSSIEVKDLPSFPKLILELCVFVLVEEVAFYYSHRLFHHPVLYKHIHKIHHQWTAPIGLTSLYAHPLEHVVANVSPALLGPLLMGSHAFTSMLWGCFALLSTSISHSGYHLPFFPSPEAHDYHHLKFNNNFGVLGVLDRLHGTDTMFRESIQKKRHFTFYNTSQGLRELIPDSKSAKM